VAMAQGTVVELLNQLKTKLKGKYLKKKSFTS
jgi:hypothetical protein